MKYTFIVTIIALLGAPFQIWSQNAGLSITWNGSAYVVKMEVVSGTNPLLLGSSQISIVTPASSTTAGIVVNCISPCSAGSWSANTFVNTPAAAPANNFVAIASPGGNMGNVTGGSSVTLFTFTLVGGCNAGVRLFNNTTDPNSGQMPSGQDFKNSLVNGLTTAEFYNGNNNNGVSCLALPLDLLRFTAQKEADLVRLNWLAANEVRLNHYDIQRSTDGIDFETIGQQRAANKALATYDYLDEPVPLARVLYYRLMIFDRENQVTYSPVRSVQFDGEDLRLSVAPNPAARYITLSIATPAESNATIQVVNAAAAIVYREQHTLIKGGNSINLAVSDWPEGTYVVSVSIGQHRKDQRFVIQR